MAKDIQASQNEERRLLTVFLACKALEGAAADQLLRPHHGMPHPAFIQLADAYQSLRVECKKKWLALREYRKTMRDDRRDDKTNNAAVLHAHALFKDLPPNPR